MHPTFRWHLDNCMETPAMLEAMWKQEAITIESAFLDRAAKAARPHTFIRLIPKQIMTALSPLDPQDADEATVLRIAQAVKDMGGRIFIVGGYVRDRLLGLPSKDLDVEVFGLDSDQLKTLLSTEGTVDCVGESFGVFMIHGCAVDWSLPRRDSKVGRGHRGIDVHTDPHLSYDEAARRRDLSINALMWDPLVNELVDPFNGIDDLRSGTLRAVDTALFSDDPLRGLRAVRIASVFGFLPDPELIALMRAQDLSELSTERLWGEWEKIALKSRLPSLALLCLEDSGLIQYFPELDALRDVQQDPQWHPEGDVYVHTAMVMDAAVKLRNGDREHDLALMFGSLCHDLGKAPTTEFIDDHWRSRGHEEAGISLTESFLHNIQSPHELIKQASILVSEHLKPVSLQKGDAKPAAYRRLARKCADKHVHLSLLAQVCEADHRGRTSLDADLDQIPYIQSFYQHIDTMNLADSAPQPAVLGRHLIERGYKPGPEMGKILEQCFEYQLDSGCVDIEEIIAHLNL